jgi:hypothetical protein
MAVVVVALPPQVGAQFGEYSTEGKRVAIVDLTANGQYVIGSLHRQIKLGMVTGTCQETGHGTSRAGVVLGDLPRSGLPGLRTRYANSIHLKVPS